VRDQPRAEFLPAWGPKAPLLRVRELLEHGLRPLRFSRSRLDLFVDVQGWSLTLEEAQSLRLPGRHPPQLRGSGAAHRVRVRQPQEPDAVRTHLRQDGRRRDQSDDMVERGVG
jgi:hypothetical protein